MTARTAVILGLLLGLAPLTQARPAFVDLRPWQTPGRDQGGRQNCFIHATVAALEAGYKRAGYGDLDLSEECSDYLGKLFFLEHCWKDGAYYTDRLRLLDAAERENSPPAERAMTVESASPCRLVSIPEERYWPGHPAPYDLAGQPDLAAPPWTQQYSTDQYALAPSNLTRRGLAAPLYYGVDSITWLPRESATQPAEIETVLAAGHEVIWDFRLAGDISQPVWQYTVVSNLETIGPHRMLLVGYDRRPGHPPYFIAKNSWGPVPNSPVGSNFTCISYDYLKYGIWASHIQRLKAPRAWPELQFLGRWKLEFYGREGILDLYHLPGMMNETFAHNQYRDENGQLIADRRVGTFFEQGDPGKAARVNGMITNNQLLLVVNFGNVSMRWDKLDGNRFEFHMSPGNPDVLKGRMVSGPGAPCEAIATRSWDGFAGKPGRTVPPALAAVEKIAVSPEQALQLDAQTARGAQIELAAKDRQQEDVTQRLKIEADLNRQADTSIREAWQKLGGSGGFLGAPRTECSVCPDGAGRFIHFDGGSIYWTAATGPHAIYGAIRDKWAELGWETCPFLGYPASDEMDTADGRGRMNTFQSGLIVWHPDTGAFALHGPVRAEWEKRGGVKGPLGYPLSDAPADASTKQPVRFQNGWMLLRPDGTVTVEMMK